MRHMTGPPLRAPPSFLWMDVIIRESVSRARRCLSICFSTTSRVIKTLSMFYLRFHNAELKAYKALSGQEEREAETSRFYQSLHSFALYLCVKGMVMILIMLLRIEIFPRDCVSSVCHSVLEKVFLHCSR